MPEPFDADPSQVVAREEADEPAFATEQDYADDPDSELAGVSVAPAGGNSRYDNDPISGSYVEDEEEPESEDAWDLTGHERY